MVTSRSRLSSDSAIGLLFVGMLALGVVIVSRSTTFSGDLIRILFGEILGIGLQDLARPGSGDGLRGVGRVRLRAALPAAVLRPRPGAGGRIPGPALPHLMLLLVATTVIVSFQTVGTLLVFGMLLAPASAGALLAHRIGAMMAVGGGARGSSSSYLGLLLSYYLNTAAGATIVLVATIIFFVVLAIVNIRVQDRGGARRGRGVSPFSAAADRDHDPHGHRGTWARGWLSTAGPSWPGSTSACAPGPRSPSSARTARASRRCCGRSSACCPSSAGELAVLGERPGGAPRRLAYQSQFHASGFVLPLRAIDVVRMAAIPAWG